MANKNPNMSGLRPPKKGEVRNPKGNNGFSQDWRSMLTKAVDENDMLEIANMGIRLAKEGNLDAIKFILEKTYPKIDKPIEINLTVDDATNSLIKRIKGQ